MARDPGAIADDVQLAGRFLAEQMEAVRRRGWLPWLLLAGAASVGLALSRRPTAEVARRSTGLVERTVQVATALAAVERFRDRRAHARATRAA
jgi:hypothetical protein